MEYLKTTAFKKLLTLNKRIRGVAGGTSASKTVSILIWLIAYAQKFPSQTVSVVSESFPHLKRGAIRDFLNIMEAQSYFVPGQWNKTDYIYTFENGSKIEFFSADQPGKVRGPRRDVLFINEANNISYETYTQLEVRTKKIVWLDWNPVSEFWFYTDVKNNRDVDFLILTYKDNEALDSAIVKSIESRRLNKNWWLVYGEGLLGEAEGRIYRGWAIIDEIPHEATLRRYGVDFGYTNDPTAIVAVYYYDGGYILDEVAYQFALGNNDIADILKNQPRALTIADSAEPKSIDELKKYGLSILASQKGKGSVNQGIQYVQQQRISVTKRSINLIKEYRNYLWITDKDGKILNEPQDFLNHCLSGDTLIWTTRGKIKIKDLVGKTGDLVTPYGIRRFYNVHKSGKGRLIELKTKKGSLRCTKEHKLQLHCGKWKKAIDIKSSELIQWIYEGKCNFGDNTRIQRNPILSLWQKVFPSQWKGVQFPTTSGGMGVPQWIDPYNSSYPSQRSQQVEQPNRKLTDVEERSAFKSSLDRRKKDVGEKECCGKGYAKSKSMAQIERGKKLAQETRIGTGIRIIDKKESASVEDVFDLSVDDVSCFVVNEGFVVRNSMDAVRYALDSFRPMLPPSQQTDFGGVKPLLPGTLA